MTLDGGLDAIADGGSTDVGPSDAGAAVDFDSGSVDAPIADVALQDVAVDSGSFVSDAGIPPSCTSMGGGEGISDCGPDGGENCCASLEVTADAYYRTYVSEADGGATQEGDPATISAFRLDKYEVTVGRFRQFVHAATSNDGGVGWLPTTGSGKHLSLNGGRGLANSASAGAYESGWDADDWNSYVAPSDTNLDCSKDYATWTPTTGHQEHLPINCVNWYEAYAFCIWDGGFLPSEAEWEFVAAGGSEQREYPWGDVDPGASNQYAIYGNYYGPVSGDALSTFAPVGAAPLGAGRWGQLDIVGNVSEWMLDWSATYVDPCVDCASLSLGASAPSLRVVRGASASDRESQLGPSVRSNGAPYDRQPVLGFRCARDP